MSEEKNNPKKRILETAIKLFADYGFAGVGVREIAKQADVNISMISYYYGGKGELLKGIIETFFETYIMVIKNSVKKGDDVNSKVNNLVNSIVDYIRENNDMARVAMYELPVGMPEIVEFKADRIKQLVKIIGDNLLSIPSAKDTFESRWFIIGPAFISMIFSNFMLGRLIKNVVDVEFDDQFYKDYTETISNLFLNGLNTLIQEGQES